MFDDETLAEANALVVFESMFGNSEQVARAVAEGLEEKGVRTHVAEVSGAPAEISDSIELLVVGAPTHAFSLSRQSTRSDAARQGADGDRVAIGLREWLASAYHEGLQPLHVAVFDTRANKARWLPAAGHKAARLARDRQFTLVDTPVAFLVGDVHGPLLEGELERARAWGRSLSAVILPAVR